MTTTAVTDSIPSAIDRDLFCFACGYNLRGLSSDGSCPECAAPIARSVAGDTLVAADPRWLGRLRVGIVLLLLAPVVSLAASIAIHHGHEAVVLAGLVSPETYRLLLVEEFFDPSALGILLPAGSVLTGLAIWFLTPRWPWARHDPKAQRLALRALAMVCVGIVIAFHLGRFRRFTSITPGAVLPMLTVVALDTLAAGLLLHYLGALSRRSRDPRLPARFTLLCILAVARMAIVFFGLCIFYWRSAAYFPAFMLMVIISLDAAPLLAVAEGWCLARLWRSTGRLAA